MDFKNMNCEETGLDRVAIRLLDSGWAEKYHYYSIFPVKNQPKTCDVASAFL